MKFTKPALVVSTLVGAAALALSAPLAASAHVEVAPSDTAAGAYSLLTFSVGHGCDGSATTGITIDLPEGIDSVTPTVNPGWDISTVEAGDRVSQVQYTALTPLADGQRTTFVLSMQLPADAAGTVLEFPTLQACEVGETNWNETAVAGEAEPAAPAPSVAVTASTGETGHHTGAAETETAAATTDTASSDDVLARVLGLGGLIVGAVGIVVAVASRRRTAE